ncbi:hypothetical protein D9M72_587670 [compost metagenome]
MSYLGYPLFNSDGDQTDFPVSFSGASRDNRFNTNSTSGFLALEQSFANDWKLKLSVNDLRSQQREDSVYLGPVRASSTRPRGTACGSSAYRSIRRKATPMSPASRAAFSMAS